MSNLLASQVLLENTFIWLQNLVKMTKKIVKLECEESAVKSYTV